MPLETPILKPIAQVLEEVQLKPYLEALGEKPIIKIGRYVMIDGPHNPGPSLLNKPKCIAWSTVVHGSRVTNEDLKDTTYGEAVHRAYYDWFTRHNRHYGKIALEPHIVIGRVTARPDIVYCNNEGECGVVEIKSYGLDKLSTARMQVAVYAYMLNQFVGVAQAWLVLRDAVLPLRVSELVELGRELFEELRRLPREPPSKPSTSCHRCPFARVCLVPKPVLAQPPNHPN